MAAFKIAFVLLFVASAAECYLLEGIYCGVQDCYSVLNVTRDATKAEIGRNYRRLAKEFHPDKHLNEDAKRVAEETFKLIATAYEILKNDEERTDYDYMLDHPEEYYAHYYRYYRRRVAPRIDVRIVLAVVITIISAIQYYSAYQRYEEAIKYFVTVPKYRHRAMEMAKDEAEAIMNRKKDGARKIPKSEQKEEMERLIRRIIEDKMDIKGSYARPEVSDVLWVQLIISPYTICAYILWYARWLWNFTLLRRPYGDEEKLYLIRKRMGMGLHQFNSLENDVIQDYLDQELWEKENFQEWKRAEEEEQKRLLAENTRYKQYRRYIKNHGVGRMTFDDS